MKKILVFFVATFLVIAVVILVGRFSGRHLINSGTVTNKILQELNDPKWGVRQIGIKEILFNPVFLEEAKIKQKIIVLSQKEGKVYQKIREKYESSVEGAPDGEAYGEYYIDLLDAVGKLRDPKTISFLVDSLEFGPGVARSLSELGDVAIPALIEKCHQGDEDERWWCLKALGLFYKQTLSSDFKSQIKSTILKAVEDSSERIRTRATGILKEIE
ncbi:MAG: HEAT repeat domain-containing protein [Deltaproteobacteria bacterium]|nr:HEAT repeat domain-containing protein [Deltaproteobacteria bacterium]